jgi:hypothetical protein
LKKLPGIEEWAGYKDEMSAREAHRIWFGKSLEEMQSVISKRSMVLTTGLEFMPRPVFQFYIFAFVQYVMSEAAIGDADAASVFLAVLAAREKRDPGSVGEIYSRLASSVDFVAASQARFDASHDVYGDFVEKAEKLRKLLGIVHSKLDPEDQYLDPTDDA